VIGSQEKAGQRCTNLRERIMIIYHRGAAFEPNVTRSGNAFVASASVLEEDGHATSLGKLGLFANEEGAINFAVRCATAFIEGDDMPVAPFELRS
jgi:hypothetical protein